MQSQPHEYGLYCLLGSHIFGLHLQIHVSGSWCCSGWQDTGMHSQAHVVEFCRRHEGHAPVLASPLKSLLAALLLLIYKHTHLITQAQVLFH